MKRICVFCGARAGHDPLYRAAAQALGEELLQHQLGLVYGGAGVGLMGVVADTLLRGQGEVIGVIPRNLFEDEVSHDHLTRRIEVDTMHQRKQTMADLADGFIALPGGFGTLEELFETITWHQLKIHAKPIGLLNTAGYYDALIGFIEHAVAEGFIQPKHQTLYHIADDAATLLAAMGVAGAGG